MDTMIRSIAKAGVSVVIFASAVYFSPPRALAQVSDQVSDEDRAKIEALLERERGMATDPTAKPSPPDDPNERDVAKRKRFGWELGHHRLGCGLMNVDSLKDANRDIAEETKASLLDRWTALLADDFKPVRPEAVRWYGQWGHYSLPDAAGNVGSRLDLIVAEWSVRGILVRASQLADSGRYVRFLLRFPKRAELQFRPRPHETDFADVKDFINWQFVSKTELRKVLMELFRWPSVPDAPFGVFGQVKNCAGIDVFAGRIGLPGAGAADPNQGMAAPAGVPERILITDSDPQYLCLSFDIGDLPPEGQEP